MGIYLFDEPGRLVPKSTRPHQNRGRTTIESMRYMLRFLSLLLIGVGLAPRLDAQILLADDTATPHATISWLTTSGVEIALEADVGYTNPNQRTTLDHNVSCFVALGGTRLDKGVGHPKGAIVRVGFYKIDAKKPFFKDIAAGSSITISLTNVKFNQDIMGMERTVLQHLKYTDGDIAACGLDRKYADCFNTRSDDDMMGQLVDGDDTRIGALDGSEETDGLAEIEYDADTVSLRAEIPYAMLRHIQDPWQLTVPGTFMEPYHFHVEFEALPHDVGEQVLEVQQQERVPDDDDVEDNN